MSGLRFDNQVVIITGAGAGLGRVYALEFAKRGAKILVNDYGVSASGEKAANPADNVVAEIKQAGGEAIANYDTVLEGQKIVQQAVDKWGRVDILINNAGFLRDRSITKMSDDEWDAIIKVHLYGHFIMNRAAWPHMKKNGFGRIINVASGSGLYGNFGQANYAAAKLGIHGMTQVLAREGSGSNIKVNTICPLAGTRLTEQVFSAEVQSFLKVEYITPLVVVLSHEKCPETGCLYEIAGGWIAKIRWQRSEGAQFNFPFTPEEVLNRWEDIIDFSSGSDHPNNSQQSFTKIEANYKRIQRGEPPKKRGAVTADATPQTAKGSSNSALALPPLQPGQLYADLIFGIMQRFFELGEGVEVVKKTQDIFNIEIVEKHGGKILRQAVVDMKNGKGSLRLGKDDSAGASFVLSDTDFLGLSTGELNPQDAFMKGTMRIRGPLTKANLFTPDLFPKPTPENLAKYLAPKL